MRVRDDRNSVQKNVKFNISSSVPTNDPVSNSHLINTVAMSI